jgi:hypothetical protein
LKNKIKAEGIVQVLEYLPRKQGSLQFKPQYHRKKKKKEKKKTN